MRLTLLVRAPSGFSYSFSLPLYHGDDEASAIAMLNAMREGLEANGYECEIESTYETKVRH